MVWKEKYRLGVSQIDEQHIELFARVTDFLEALHGEGPWEDKVAEVKKTMAFMQQYVVVHFASEEALQRRIGYSGYERHHKIHGEFTADIAASAKRFEEHGYDEESVKALAGKLLAWLINHVAAEDQKIAAEIKRDGGAA